MQAIKWRHRLLSMMIQSIKIFKTRSLISILSRMVQYHHW
uniref:Uncharacterized protein n=1 Tax=Rhizophora mucronata TaxID=61149 RepID=A0A2P2PRF7_RHIMU